MKLRLVLVAVAAYLLGHFHGCCYATWCASKGINPW